NLLDFSRRFDLQHRDGATQQTHRRRRPTSKSFAYPYTPAANFGFQFNLRKGLCANLAQASVEYTESGCRSAAECQWLFETHKWISSWASRGCRSSGPCRVPDP